MDNVPREDRKKGRKEERKGKWNEGGIMYHEKKGRKESRKEN